MPSPKSPLSVLPANPIHSRNSHHKRVPRPLAPPGQRVPATTDAPAHATDVPETGMGMVPPPTSPMRTLAEAYADAHTHLHPCHNPSPPAAQAFGERRSQTLPAKDTRERERERERDREKKPLFDWLTRKLTTAGRRPTIPEPSMSLKQPRSRTRLTSMPKPRALGLSGGREEKEAGRGESAARMSRADTFPSVSFSISSAANTLDRERRREANNPYPSLPLGQGVRGRHKQGYMDDATTMSTTLSGGYSGDNDGASGSGYGTASRRSSRSGVLDGFEEGDSGRADDDASLRPFPPSVRASSPTFSSYRSISNSMLHHSAYRRTIYSVSSAGGVDEDNASYDGSEGEADENEHEADDERSRQRRVSRDGSTSTKPTTCISFDSGPGVAHIAQGAHPSTSHISASQHSLTQMGGGESIPYIHTSEASTPVFSTSPTSTSPASLPQQAHELLQAPKHTNPHPRHNPHPSSPPDPNASTLTLASSHFALSQTPGAGGTGSRDHRPSSVITCPSVLTWAEPSSTPLSASGGIDRERDRDRDRSAVGYPPSIQTMGHLSLYTPSISVSLRGGVKGIGGERGEGGRADRDASVRAVRRKGSWESYESRWSWRGAGAGAGQSNGGTSQMGGTMTNGERDKGTTVVNEGKELERVPESPSVVAVK